MFLKTCLVQHQILNEKGMKAMKVSKVSVKSRMPLLHIPFEIFQIVNEALLQRSFSQIDQSAR